MHTPLIVFILKIDMLEHFIFSCMKMDSFRGEADRLYSISSKISFLAVSLHTKEQYRLTKYLGAVALHFEK